MPFRARYSGTCVCCGQPIAKGDLITWSRRRAGARGGKAYYHVECAKNMPAEEQLPADPADPQPEQEEASQPAQQEPTLVTALTALSSLGATLETLHNRLEDVESALTQTQPTKATTTEDIDEAKVRDIVQQTVQQALAEVARPTVVVLQDRDGRQVDVEGVQHKMFPRLLYHIQNRENVYLYGPSQSGKSNFSPLFVRS